MKPTTSYYVVRRAGATSGRMLVHVSRENKEVSFAYPNESEQAPMVFTDRAAATKARSAAVATLKALKRVDRSTPIDDVAVVTSMSEKVAERYL